MRNDVADIVGAVGLGMTLAFLSLLGFLLQSPKADCRCDKQSEVGEQTDDDALLPPGEYEPIIVGPVAKDETFCGGQP